MTLTGATGGFLVVTTDLADATELTGPGGGRRRLALGTHFRTWPTLLGEKSSQKETRGGYGQ